MSTRASRSAFTRCGIAGVVALLSIGTAAADNAASSRFPGECVPIPKAHLDVANESVTWSADTHRIKITLDRRGSATFLVPIGDPARVYQPGAVEWTIYLRPAHRTCGHVIGMVQGLSDPYLERGASHGLRNLASRYPDEGRSRNPSHVLRLTHYVYDGTQYVQTGAAEER